METPSIRVLNNFPVGESLNIINSIQFNSHEWKWFDRIQIILKQSFFEVHGQKKKHRTKTKKKTCQKIPKNENTALG